MLEILYLFLSYEIISQKEKILRNQNQTVSHTQIYGLVDFDDRSPILLLM